jgi:hypothetical protein
MGGQMSVDRRRRAAAKVSSEPVYNFEDLFERCVARSGTLNIDLLRNVVIKKGPVPN